MPRSTMALLVLILSTMSNTVRDVQQEDLATTEGLDELFADTEVETADSLPTSADRSESVADILTADAEIIEWLTTTQAAALLGKSERTIQRYAKAGKLKSRSDESGKLFVAVVDTVDSVPTPADGMPTSADNFESVADSSTTDADSLTSDNTSVPTSVDSIYDKVIDDYRGQINELQRKLEGASFQLGRMQAEIEHKDAEIKLLTDSQSKSGRWVRFTKWFFGQ